MAEMGLGTVAETRPEVSVVAEAETNVIAETEAEAETSVIAVVVSVANVITILLSCYANRNLFLGFDF